MFNYLKLYAIIYFIQYIQNYDSTINHNIVYNKIVYKYLLKIFYRQTNKKKQVLNFIVKYILYQYTYYI